MGVDHDCVLPATELAPSAFAPRFARTVVTGALVDLGAVALRDDAVLLTSELVTNAVVHARSPCRLRLARLCDPDRLRVEVEDESPDQPRRGRPRPDEPHGRGLFLIDAIAHDWGVRRRAGGKVVWFELRL